MLSWDEAVKVAVHARNTWWEMQLDGRACWFSDDECNDNGLFKAWRLPIARGEAEAEVRWGRDKVLEARRTMEGSRWT